MSLDSENPNVVHIFRPQNLTQNQWLGLNSGMKMAFTKKQLKAIRRLAGLAYERELSEALSDLATGFDEWRGGTIDAFQLHDAVHRYHNGPARDSWSRYQSSKALLSVPLAIARGYLQPNDLPPEIRDALVEQAESLKDVLNFEDQPNDEA